MPTKNHYLPATHILFDLDGTLSDSAPGIVASVAYALDKMEFAYEDYEQLRSFVGPPLREQFMSFCNLETIEEGDKAVSLYREFYTTKGIFDNTAYDGIPEMLDKLSELGLRLAVATSKPEIFARQIIERYGFADKFDYIGGSLLDGTRTDKAQVIQYVMKELDVKPENCVMVGDREHDIVGGKKCGLSTIGVLWGYGGRQELENAGAHVIVEHPGDIVGLF